MNRKLMDDIFSPIIATQSPVLNEDELKDELRDDSTKTMRQLKAHLDVVAVTLIILVSLYQLQKLSTKSK